MKILGLSVEGFRGIRRADLRFGDHTVIIGPNGCGKSTIVDALSLVFGRTRLVRELTEHDFFGSSPEPQTRIHLVATLGGFSSNDPARHDMWFRDGRAVPKWWNVSTGKAEVQRSKSAETLCAQIGFAARFDHEDLSVETLRYFQDDDALDDPFEDGAAQSVPTQVLHEIGYYVLPARRTWESTISFASDLFRNAVATIGGIPAATVLAERDKLRRPDQPLEQEPRLKPLVDRVNAQLSQLMPQCPEFQLRVTSTDSESLLRALVPHYQSTIGTALPAARHGTGLLSLQTFILLLEIGRERRTKNQSFILAMEEPELHVPPGLQRRLIGQSVAVAGQTICTSHAPRVASFYPAASVQVVEAVGGNLTATPLLVIPLGSGTSQAIRKLYNDDRLRVVEGLMHHRVLIPEGRSDCEWLRLLSDVVETGEQALRTTSGESPPFGAVVGVVPTHNSAVVEVYEQLRRLRGGVVPLVDGDAEGLQKVRALKATARPPETVVRWPDGWSMEDVIGWILRGDEAAILPDLQTRLAPHEFATVDDLVALFKIDVGPRRLKTDYLAYEEVAAAIRERSGCVARAALVLAAITAAALGTSKSLHLEVDRDRSIATCSVMRFKP